VVQVYPTFREISPRYIMGLQYTVVHFSRFLGRTATMDDFQDSTVNCFLTWYADLGRAPETVNNVRRQLLTLWRFCVEADWIDRLPRKVKTIRRPNHVVQAWTAEDVAKILQAASGEWTKVRGHWPLAWGDLLRAVVLLGCNSALRLGDLLAAKWSDVSGDRTLRIVQHKTGNALSVDLWDDTLDSLERIRNGHERLVGGRVNDDNLQIRFRHLLQRIGVRGSIRWLRKTGATWANETGIASQLLGHRSGSALAQRHYVDSRASVVRPAQPAGLLATPAPFSLSAPLADKEPPAECPWGSVDVGAGQCDGKDGVA